MLNVKGLTKKIQALLGTGSRHAGFVLQHDKRLLTTVVKYEPMLSTNYTKPVPKPSLKIGSVNKAFLFRY